MAARKKTAKKESVKKTPVSKVVKTVPAPVKVPELSKSDILWAKIKDLPLNVFGIPNQTVANSVIRHELSPDAIYLTLKASGALPALEEVLLNVPIAKDEQFDVTKVDQYIVIKTVKKQALRPFVTKLESLG